MAESKYHRTKLYNVNKVSNFETLFSLNTLNFTQCSKFTLISKQK